MVLKNWNRPKLERIVCFTELFLFLCFFLFPVFLILAFFILPSLGCESEIQINPAIRRYNNNVSHKVGSRPTTKSTKQWS